MGVNTSIVYQMTEKLSGAINVEKSITTNGIGGQVKKIWLIVPLALMAGCSATSLRCGVQDDNSSYVELINVPQDLSSQARHFTDLCGFAYEKVESP